VKYEAAFEGYFTKQTLFNTDDARRFLSSIGASEGYIRLMLHNLVHAGKLLRIGKGVYTYQRNESIIGFRFRPFYYGLQYALTIRRIWTQQSVPVILTKSRANPGVRDLMGIRVILHRINDKAFFGFDYINYGGIFVPVSDVEKTLLDFTYYGISLDRETLSALENAVNRKKLAEYTNRLHSISRKN